MQTLRVATLNIWNKSGPWPERLPLLRTQLTELSPDVVGLQEVLRLIPDESSPPAPTPENDQASEVAEGLGYQVAYGAAADYSGGLKFGNALLSRYKILDSRTFPLPGVESGETRSMLYALLETPWGRLPAFVTHLNWKFHHGVVRERQVVAVAELAERWGRGADFPPIIVGDLNADPEATEIRFLCGLASVDGRSTYFQDAWRVRGAGPGFTWDNRDPYTAMMFEPDRRLDYVLVGLADTSGRGWIERVALAFDQPLDGVWASDHFGVVADIRV